MTNTTRRGPRGDLSVDSIVAVGKALALGTPQPVTLRGVARSLGVLPNALYTYVGSTAELRHRVGDAVLADCDLAGLRTTAWCPQCRIADIVNQLETLFVRHPGAAALFAAGRVIGPASLALNESLLDCLADGGLDPMTAANAVDAMTALLHGVAVLAPTEALTSQDHRRLAEFDPADYPRTAAMPDSTGGLAEACRALLTGLGVASCPATDRCDR